MCRCDLEVVALIEQVLDENGPMTLEEFLASPTFSTSNRELLTRILAVHSTEFTTLPDGRIWFPTTPLPTRSSFSTFQDAIEFALQFFPDGATTEELKRILCLSNCSEGAITRLALARELSAKPGLFLQLQRGRYALADAPSAIRSAPVILRLPICSVFADDEENFNPDTFFGGRFQFAAE
jgi:hypothetical protein